MVALNGNLTQGQECGCRSHATSERFVSLCLGGETDSLPAGRCSPASRGKLLIIERIADAYGNTIIITANWGSDSATQSAYGANDIIYYRYPDYGVVIMAIGTGLYDRETELYYVRNRMYNPALGRWTQRDPIGYQGGINLYEYVVALAATATDPFGMDAGGNDCCGPEISAFLTKIRVWVFNTYFAMSLKKANLIMGGAPHSGVNSPGGWDIGPLAAANVTGTNGARMCHGEATVSVLGHCYRQVDVNYWLFGVIWRAYVLRVEGKNSSFWRTHGTTEFEPPGQPGGSYQGVMENYIEAYRILEWFEGQELHLMEKIVWADAGFSDDLGLPQSTALSKCKPSRAAWHGTMSVHFGTAPEFSTNITG